MVVQFWNVAVKFRKPGYSFSQYALFASNLLALKSDTNIMQLKKDRKCFYYTRLVINEIDRALVLKKSDVVETASEESNKKGKGNMSIDFY